MADFQHKDNTFTLFKNKYKTKDSHPDYKGKGMFNGKPMDVAGWGKVIGDEKALSCQISEPYQKPQEEQQSPPPAVDPECPF